MIFIGVTGKSGSGKTLFGDMLAQDDRVDVIHVDAEWEKAKSKYFSWFTKKMPKGDNTKIKTSSSMDKFIFTNKFVFGMVERIRARMAKKFIDQKIEEFEKAGKEIIVIDDAYLKYVAKYYQPFDRIYLLKRKLELREEGKKQRDGSSNNINDMAHNKGTYEEYSDEEVDVVINNGTKEELAQKAKKVINDLLRNSFLDEIKEKTPDIHHIIPKETQLPENSKDFYI